MLMLYSCEDADAEASQVGHTVSSRSRIELSQDLRWREIKSSGGLTVALSSAIMNPTMYPGGNSPLPPPHPTHPRPHPTPPPNAHYLTSSGCYRDFLEIWTYDNGIHIKLVITRNHVGHNHLCVKILRWWKI